MSTIKVDQVNVYTPNTNGVNFANGLFTGSTTIKPTQIAATDFLGNADISIGFAYPTSANSMTSKYYVDQRVGSLLSGAGLSGVDKTYVDNQDTAGVNNTNTKLLDYVKLVSPAAGQTISGLGITFSGGPYTFASSNSTPLSVQGTNPSLLLKETDFAGSSGSFFMDSGILKLVAGLPTPGNVNGLSISSNGSVGIGTANITTANITTANITTANITTANITTANTTTANTTTENTTTANITTLNMNGAASGLPGNITFGGTKQGLVGVYDPQKTQAIWAMGAAFTLGTNTASDNYGDGNKHYGLAWSYNPDYGGATPIIGNNPQSKAGLNHQLLIQLAGVTQTAIGSGIWTIGNVTAPTANITTANVDTLNINATGTGIYLPASGNAQQIQFTSVGSPTLPNSIQSPTVAALPYSIYREGGTWDTPYPDLVISYHTGIKLIAYNGYGGTRFYSYFGAGQQADANILLSVGNTDNHVRVGSPTNTTSNLIVYGNIVAPNQVPKKFAAVYAYAGTIYFAQNVTAVSGIATTVTVTFTTGFFSSATSYAAVCSMQDTIKGGAYAAAGYSLTAGRTQNSITVSGSDDSTYNAIYMMNMIAVGE